jgi:uracil-DNA glycosylase
MPPPHESWLPLFNQYNFPLDEIYADVIVYPPRGDVFRVFEMPLHDIRLVILGQDPYHGPGQAHGLAFSVPRGVPTPPSLQNIFKELAAEFPERSYNFTSGDLTPWSKQGIFLLNTALTVKGGQPNSHVDIWSDFTDDVITFIAENTTATFLLLGAAAKKKARFLSSRAIQGVHPSPLSAHRGFFGSNIFKQVEAAVGPIDWSN